MKGAAAERLVVERLRAVLDAEVEVLHGLRWILLDRGHVTEGEADVVIADPARGILVIEVKAGTVRRDGDGVWWIGSKPLQRSPFQQAADSRHALIRKVLEMQGATTGIKPVAGQAVAFPDVDMDSARGLLDRLPLDADPWLIADQSMFVDDADGRRELRAFIDRAFDAWSAKAGTQAPGHALVDLLVATMTEPLELRSMLRFEIANAEPEVVRLTTAQYQTLNRLRYTRRAAIVGGAGTGKTMLAAEKARRLAREGFETLLICFNSPLSAMLGDAVDDVSRETGRLQVKTFHQLCEDLGREAGVLGDRPDPAPQDWFDRTLTRALDEAIERLGPRYHAIVVDEGQDFDAEWLASLNELLIGGNEDVFYVFHDPAQALFREDVVEQLGMQAYPLDENCRNAQTIHDVVRRFAGEGLAAEALRSGGRPPEFIEAEDAQATLKALRGVLHRLRVDEAVRPWDIAVLSGARLDKSAVWAVPGRQFGNEVLGNAAVDDAGRNLGLPAHLVPRLPDDVILCETIRRFKGLERPVIVLVELPEDDARLDRLLYVGASRARQHLVVIGPAAVLGRLGSPGSARVSESQDEPQGVVEAGDRSGAQSTRLRPEEEGRQGRRLVALRPAVARQPGLTTVHPDEEIRLEGRGFRGTRHGYHDDGGRPSHSVDLDDDARMRAADDVTADIGEVDDVDVASRWTDGRGRMADSYHSSSDHSLAVMGRNAIAQSRFSWFCASSAASNLACSASSSVRRRAAPISALTLTPPSAAAALTSATSSVGRLIDSLVWGPPVPSVPYAATASANARLRYDRTSLMVGTMVGREV